LRKNVVAAIESLEQHVKLPSFGRQELQEFRSCRSSGVADAHRSVDLDSTFNVMNNSNLMPFTGVCPWGFPPELLTSPK
jgi:hypothetical protein